ncbi:MAG: chromosomal replication initiator protein DnaA [Candidatus Pacebacteria bacterium]|nr:chromosomal replication initiator protein DnaA [Candidatus Paceibacterota bacterium]
MNTLEKTWKDTLTEIELEISRPNFNTWFKKTFPIKQEDGVFYLGVPNEFNKEWLYTKFHKMILEKIRKFDEGIKSIEYIVKRQSTQESTTITKNIETIGNNSLPLEKNSVNKSSNLNEKYSFQSFVVGPFNEIAYSASQAIIKKPGEYNPLFIYGPTGLGKTHLIQATGNKMKGNYDHLEVFYTSSEKFSQDYVNALKNNSIINFKNKYRNYDVLIMDDIQFFSGKEKLQEELFHLFNILYEKGKQIIFSSDKHPNYIIGLEDRLRSRFSQGMIIDVTKPDYESRAALLKTKATQKKTAISDEVIDYLASNLEGNIRELEGILNAISIQTELRARKLTISEVKSLIKNNIKPKKHLALEEIIKIIAGFYSIAPEQIYEKTRKKEIVYVRQVVMYILREYFNISYPAIGKEIGGRDHTTVIHSYDKVSQNLKDDPNLNKEIEQLRAVLDV